MSTNEARPVEPATSAPDVPDANTRAKWRATGLGFRDLRTALEARLERGDMDDREWKNHVDQHMATLRRGLGRMDTAKKMAAVFDVPTSYWTSDDVNEIKGMALGFTPPQT